MLTQTRRFQRQLALPVAMLGALLGTAPALCAGSTPTAVQTTPGWQDDFGLAHCKMTTTGRNDYFVLEPGHQLVLGKGDIKMQITVLDETKVIDGVTTRVVEEREWDKGQLTEVSRNYYVMCEQTKDVLHFGEDVEVYDKGKFVKNEGTWIAGTHGNRPGLLVSGTPKPGMRYYQEIAPGIAMNRGEIMSLTATCKTMAGTFTQCMKVKGTSSMDKKKLEYKYYAPRIGLVQDEDLGLMQYGPAAKP